MPSVPGNKDPWFREASNTGVETLDRGLKAILAIAVTCLVISLGVCAFVIWSIAEFKEDQIRFETDLTNALLNITKALEAADTRQTSLETVVATGTELRLTVNEIKRYNEKQYLGDRQKCRSKRIPHGIGGE